MTKEELMVSNSLSVSLALTRGLTKEGGMHVIEEISYRLELVRNRLDFVLETQRKFNEARQNMRIAEDVL